MITSRLSSTCPPYLNPISQLFLLPFCVHRREEIAKTHSQNSIARVIPSHTIQSLCFGDYQPLWCWSFCVPVRNVLLQVPHWQQGQECSVSFLIPQRAAQGRNHRNITKIRRAFSMKIDPHFIDSLLLMWLEEQLHSTDKMREVKTMMRFWCLWKSFRTSPSLKRM